jgi:hypothetical protein
MTGVKQNSEKKRRRENWARHGGMLASTARLSQDRQDSWPVV